MAPRKYPGSRKNGHIINSLTILDPSRKKDFCDQCGAGTIVACEHCGRPIRGGRYYFHLGSPQAQAISRIPAFCEKCGEPYPWTESKLEAARDLASQLGLDIPERTLLEKSIEEIVRDTPRAAAEAVKFRKITEKAPAWAMEGFNKILVNVVTESVKRIIWPTP